MKYQIVADESVDYRIVVRLREIGFRVYSITEHQPSINDVSVLTIASNNNSLLITEDKDFGELVFRLQCKHRGVLLIRIGIGAEKVKSVCSAIERHYQDLLNKFSVIDDMKLRIKN